MCRVRLANEHPWEGSSYPAPEHAEETQEPLQKEEICQRPESMALQQVNEQEILASSNQYIPFDKKYMNIENGETH